MKKAIITGGTGAIGSALVEEFAADYEVVFTYLTNKEAASVLSGKTGATGYPLDISNRNAVEEFFAELKSCDLLINNAGISQIKLFTDITPTEWDKMLAVNLTGAFNMTSCVIPLMLNRKRGVIINVSSVWGVSGASCEVHYSAAKAGLIGFTKSLAKEVGLSGVRVNCIAPGVIESPMNEKLGADVLDDLKSSSALGKLGKPEDVAKAARYFATADYVTGQVLVVDGGFLS